MLFSGINSFISSLQADPLGTILEYVFLGVCILLSLILHECAHGYVALKCGDPTAWMLGRLSLNPAKHLDPIGTLCMVFLRVGWAKPVPVNMNRFRNPKRGMALTALAGPASNLILAAVFLFLYGLCFLPLSKSAAGRYFLKMIDLTAVISIGLGIFNLLPIPPLDGSKILFSFLSDGSYRLLMRYERYVSLLLFALVWAGVLGKPLSAAINGVYGVLYPMAQGGFSLGRILFNR